tara:strand:+ start:422 stop:1570 length:1149 start_codon:yes stop_codon:yes gene_type:complete
MKIYKNNTVYEEALNRIRFLYDEFDEVVVGYSGGKDSTVTLRLAVQVAKEKGKLPVKAIFIDQEAEWGAVIEHMREVREDPDVDLRWYQVPFGIYNASSNIKQWLVAWGEGVEWMRPREPNSITENKYGTDRFYDLFNKIIEVDFPENTCLLGGVRSEESPRRHVAMTQQSTYKYITWGKKLNPAKRQYTFYPIYDWSYTDIWKSIHDNKWAYTKVYDYQYMYGVPIRAMRVSNLHHETAISVLFYLQEVERDTWTALTNRMSGISTAGKLNKDNYFIKELPFMFRSWEEYRDFLTEKLVQDESLKDKFKKKWELYDVRYKDMLMRDKLIRAEINTVLANDVDLAKLRNFTETPEMEDYRRWTRGEEIKYKKVKNKYIPYDI